MLNERPARLAPLIKYPGGKERELKYILPALPADAERFFDPFVGGGSVYLAADADEFYINDFSAELMLLWSCVKDRDAAFFADADAFSAAWDFLGQTAEAHRWELICLYQYCARPQIIERGIEEPLDGMLDRMIADAWPDYPAGTLLHGWWKSPEWKDELLKSFVNKFRRMNELEEEKGLLTAEDCFKNIETCLKNAFYMYIRGIYNRSAELRLSDGTRAALYFFIREYCYSSMFRYNAHHEFNVPYGGISYNHKSLSGKIAAMRAPELAAKLAKTGLGREDFAAFLDRYAPGPKDFVFVDPPYDTTFSSYDGSAFGKEDQKRLADWLCEKCGSRFLLIIKNTEYIRSLYPEGRPTKGGEPLRLYQFDKKYYVSFMARNDRKSEHLMIANYALPEIL
ncbi:MAG: DNA adenine methylase [Lachnospiraceae bacterium]|nr:DNA adenine methylase [Lachnospiraceae bacterium]